MQADAFNNILSEVVLTYYTMQECVVLSRKCVIPVVCVKLGKGM